MRLPLFVAAAMLCAGPLSFSSAHATQIISFGGDLNLSGGTIFNMSVNGPVRGSDYDSLSVAGKATLAGTLNFLVGNNFTPFVGEQFEAVSYGSYSGAFGSIVPFNLGSNLYLTADYRANGLYLTVASNTTNTSATPEPSSLALLGTGLFGMVGVMKRRLAQ